MLNLKMSMIFQDLHKELGKVRSIQRERERPAHEEAQNIHIWGSILCLLFQSQGYWSGGEVYLGKQIT